MKFFRLFFVCAAIGLSSCSMNRSLTKNIQRLNTDSLFNNAHIGFILQNEAGKTLVKHNAEKFFIPASNTKLFTTYAILKAYPDSLPGWFIHQNADTLFLKPNGDPTFLNKDFNQQKVWQLMLATNNTIVVEQAPITGFSRLGMGWSWSSYQESYMPERLAMPIYGNVVRFVPTQQGIKTEPSYFQQYLRSGAIAADKKISIRRAANTNQFMAIPSSANALVRPFTQQEDAAIAYHLLADTLSKLNKQLTVTEGQQRPNGFWKALYTQKTEEVLQPMMHHSDNFLAEQLLLMAGNKFTGQLSDRAAIAALKKDEFAGSFQNFIWVDGSGLSRNDNISPLAISQLLRKMKQEFGWEKLIRILQHGNQGTTSGYYKGYENNIWSKTGTLGGNSTTLSGYLITQKGHRYTFSFLVNNHHQNQVAIRRAIEKYLVNIIENH